MLALLLAAATSLMAQLSAPNPMGVSMGHLHLNTTDPAASRKFWVDFLGGQPVKFANTEAYKFIDTFVMARKGTVSGGTEGTAVNHLGFKVKDLDAYLAKCEQMGFKIVRRMPDTRQAFIMGPDELKVELSEDRTMTAAIAHHHIHFANQKVPEIQAWYAKMFGAKPGKRGKFEAADLPGVNLSFLAVDAPVKPTKGTAMDHIGFEVKNLEAFVKKLEAEGVKLDIPYRSVPAIKLSIAFFTDPWGTYVELTEGLTSY